MKFYNYDLNGNQITIPSPESYKDCIQLIKSDRYRISGKIESLPLLILHNTRPFKSSILFWFRLCQYDKGWLWLICRFMYKRACCKAQVQIPPATKVGYGLYLGGHDICIVINGGTVIGNNVNLAQFLNIGTNHHTPAIIGDNVYFGPHVSIVENVKIGNNSSIGAGAVVIKDVPENATVAGVPAKVLNYNNPGRYIYRPWPSTIKTAD